MPDLPEVRERFVADTTGYSRPLREAAQDADKFSRNNDQAALAARRMGLAAKEAADKAARAMSAAGEAAEKLAMGEIDAKEAAEAEARALRDMERAAIKAAEAERATARAAEEAARQHRQEARDAELAATAERLGALKAAGATKDYNALLARTKQQHGDLSKTAVGGFKLMENEGNAAYKALSAGSEKLGEANKLGVVAVANGLVMLPALATVAAGALTLGLGGAIAAVGVMFAARNAEIKKEYSTLGHEIFAGLSADAAPFEDTLRHIAEAGSDEFRSWQPEIRDIFKEMAPAVDHAATQAIHALDEFKPAAREIAAGFDAELGALGDRSGEIAHNIAVGIEAIGKAAQQNPKALADMVNSLSLMVRYGGDAIGFLVRFKSEFDGFMQVFAGGGPMGLVKFIDGIVKLKNAFGGGIVGKAAGEFDTFSGAARDAAGAETQTGMATEQLKTTMDMAKLAAQQMTAAFDAAAGKTLSERESMIAYRQSITAMTQALKQNGAAHGFATAKGAANEQALDGMAVAAQKAAAAMKDDGRSAKDVSSFLEGARQRIIAAAEKMHYSASAAKDLADKLLGVRNAALSIPGSRNTKLNNNAAAAAAALRDYQHWINALHGKTVYVHTVYTASGSTTFGAGNRKLGNKDGGLYKKRGYDSGGEVSGLVVGPGTGTSDDIPAPWLSNGEFVTREVVTRKHLAALDALNRGMSWMQAGMLAGERYAVGGKVTHTGMKPPSKAQLAADRVTLARSRPEYLAALASQKALESMRASIYGGYFRGGSSTVGSAHGSVVQHVTNVNVTVQGSVTTVTKLAADLQGIFLRSGMSLNLPVGR